MKIYLDGCSFTYGQGIDRSKSIGSLLQKDSKFTVFDKSAPAKSNYAIVKDTWDNRHNYDIFVLGFTFSDRITVNFRDMEYHLHPANPRHRVDYQHYHDAFIEDALALIHRGAYTLYDNSFYDHQSDYLVDMIITKLHFLNKIVIPFSWEKRNTDWEIFYPVFNQEHRISESDRHLNEKGTKNLYDILLTKILKNINEK